MVRMEQLEERIELTKKNFHSKGDYTGASFALLEAELKTLEKYMNSIRLHQMAGIAMPEDGEWIVEPEGDAPGIFARNTSMARKNDGDQCGGHVYYPPRSVEPPDLPRQRLIPQKPPVREYSGDNAYPGRFSSPRKSPPDVVEAAPVPVPDEYRGGSVEMYMKLKQEHDALVIAHNQLTLAREVNNAWYTRLWNWFSSIFR